ncbi:MAG TPA: hypothetical protein VKX17_15780 [Planctomycetota bacterium]|nr:hypothetical protein [Planctomycetota bacterium]
MVAPNGPSKQSNEISNALRSAKSEIEKLRQELDRTTLIVQALWEMLKKKHGATEEEMLQTIESVDLMDGKLDGKPSRIPENCPDCQRPVSVATSTCFFCGTPVVRKRVF